MVDRDSTRVIEEAKYMIKTKGTIRKCADHFAVCKSTVHKDLRERLKKINYDLYGQVNNILEQNLRERHIRGGEVTKERYKKKKVE